MGAREEAAEHPDCNVCAGKVQDEEVAAGLRCAQCRTSFDDVGTFRHPEHDAYCQPCGSVQDTKGERGPSYGAGKYR